MAPQPIPCKPAADAPGSARSTQPAQPLLLVENLSAEFSVARGRRGRRGRTIRAVDDVSFAIEAGRTLGLVGESGCGKTTLGRTILRLTPAAEGRVTFNGTDVLSAGRAALRRLRRDMQIIFQDPVGSLNPRMRVGSIVAEPLAVHGVGNNRERRDRVAALLERVGLRAADARRFPHEFSGGQRQRIGVARALALDPKLIICDEPVSALDVSVQAQIINLLRGLQRELGLAYLFIAHNLAVVRHISDRVAVMYLGRIVETAEADGLFNRPRHPYTMALLQSIPEPDPAQVGKPEPLAGEPPSPLAPPPGCAFNSRCPHATDKCRTMAPHLESKHGLPAGHHLACHHAEAISTG